VFLRLFFILVVTIIKGVVLKAIWKALEVGTKPLSLRTMFEGWIQKQIDSPQCSQSARGDLLEFEFALAFCAAAGHTLEDIFRNLALPNTVPLWFHTAKLSANRIICVGHRELLKDFAYESDDTEFKYPNILDFLHSPSEG